MNVRTTLKTVAATTLIALSLGSVAAQADTTIEIQRHPGYGWKDGPRVPPRAEEFANQERQNRIDQRQDEQMDRILQGIETGRLDKNEAVALLREQRDIAKQERFYLSDGYLSRDEYQSLQDKLDAADRHIFREKHDLGWYR